MIRSSVGVSINFLYQEEPAREDLTKTEVWFYARVEEYLRAAIGTEVPLP